MSLPLPSDWLALLETVGGVLQRADPEETVTAFLQAVVGVFGWATAEYWVLEDGVYRRVHECHSDVAALHDFITDSEGVSVPGEWIEPQAWQARPDVRTTMSRRVYWLANATESDLTYRHELLTRAGLNTLVFIAVPNDTFVEQALILLDFPSRQATEQELRALTIATLLLGRRLPGKAKALPLQRPEFSPERVTHLDAKSHSLVGPYGAVRLTVSEWDLLQVLFDHEDALVSFELIAQEVWRVAADYVGRPAIYEMVARVRRRLAAVSHDYRIASIARLGYLLQRVTQPPESDIALSDER